MVLIARALEKAPKIKSLNFGLSEIGVIIAIALNRDGIPSVNFNKNTQPINYVNHDFWRNRP